MDPGMQARSIIFFFKAGMGGGLISEILTRNIKQTKKLDKSPPKSIETKSYKLNVRSTFKNCCGKKRGTSPPPDATCPGPLFSCTMASFIADLSLWSIVITWLYYRLCLGEGIIPSPCMSWNSATLKPKTLIQSSLPQTEWIRTHKHKHNQGACKVRNLVQNIKTLHRTVFPM